MNYFQDEFFSKHEKQFSDSCVALNKNQKLKRMRNILYYDKLVTSRDTIPTHVFIKLDLHRRAVKSLQKAVFNLIGRTNWEYDNEVWTKLKDMIPKTLTIDLLYCVLILKKPFWFVEKESLSPLFSLSLSLSLYCFYLRFNSHLFSLGLSRLNVFLEQRS